MNDELKNLVEAFEKVYGEAMRSNDISRAESINLQDIRMRWDELMKRYLKNLEDVDKRMRSDFFRLKEELDRKFKEYAPS
jgi:hypothetical protein